MRDDRRVESTEPSPAREKRPYHPPVLTEYGSVEALVDAGAVLGAASTVPSLTILAL